MTKKINGFTLSEVLITLMVIGVVAALAIPALLSTTNDAELKTKWKKAYSNLSNVTNLIIQEQGGTLTGAFTGDTAGSEVFKDAYKAKLAITKDCSGTATKGGSGTGATTEGCWHGANENKYLNGTLITTQTILPGLILNDGTMLFFAIEHSDCSTNRGSFYTCGFIRIDVNGFRGPNTYGKDIFGVAITPNRLVPYGAQGWLDPATTCIEGSTDVGNKGYGCSAKYLYE